MRSVSGHFVGQALQLKPSGRSDFIFYATTLFFHATLKIAESAIQFPRSLKKL